METLSAALAIAIFSGIGNIFLGIIALKNNPKSTTNKLFLSFIIVLVSYIFLNHFSQVQKTDTLTILFIRLVIFNAVLINYLFYLLVTTFPNEKLTLNRRLFSVLTIFTLFLLPLTLSPFIFKSVSPGTNYPIPGVGIPLFLLHTILFLGFGIFNLIKKYKISTGITKEQIRLLLLGTLFMFLAILITNLVFVVIFNTSSFVGLLPLYTTFFAGVVTYAIVKHELFDIKVIATQALIIIICIVLFAKIFASVSVGETIVDVLVFVSVFILGILLVKSVINEVKQRQKLEELTQRLQELDKQKDEFISMAAHELRSPLTAIKGYLSMIIEGDAGEITSKAHEFLTDTSSVTDRLIRLVNNMLNVSRIEEGRMVFQMEEESMIKVAEETYNTFRFEAERQKLEFKLTIPDGLRHIVYVDPDKLREILGNLVSNALKYTQTGSVTIQLSNPTSETVKAEVVDTGPGITVEEQNKLFQKFYRAESTAGKTVGTGLGLYITKLLIERFKGKLGLVSEPGKGSNFWFEIPVYNMGSEKNV